ncbi:peptidyl-prolyl cis-trans isomerase cyp11 [Rhopalosiphum maidis]|nr:peptidyl-prolyl cis-trans isomerase cyp11 [Rhopalosiphum maidis]XP_026815668.1 peptidyl-prolyl cis-trans isomerase cyp11 [Rhopalosiphum maidis]
MGVDTELVKTHVRPRCFMDVAVDNILLGRIVFELFDDFCPLTCENFRALCTGEKGLGKTTGKPLHFQGVIFHRVVKSFMVQCGDFSTGNGTGGESIFGGTFPDENFDLKHDQPFLLSMANRGPDTNGSQFFITTQPTPHLDGIHVVFGRVVSGQPVVMQIEELGVDKNSRPLQDAKVVKCGELILKSKIKQETEKSASDSETSSGSDDDKKRKRKKKKKEKESKRKTEKKSDRLKEENDDADADGQLHPLVSVSNIDPEEIPAGPPNRFLSRGGPSSMFLMKPQKDNDDRPKKRNRIRGVTKSGRIVKGRGTLRFRTPSRSRSRSYTPPHWRQEQKKMITFNEFEKLEIERKEKEEEIKRREEARKKRHEEREKREKSKNGQTPPGSPPKGSDKQSDKIEIDMMANIEDVFQIIRDRNIKNGSDNRDHKKADQRLSDIKKKSKGDNREKFQKMEKKFDRRSRSRSPKRRFDDNFRRDRVQRDGNRYRKDDRYNNKSTQERQRNRSRDREHFDKKKKHHRRSSSSSSEDRKSKKKVKNENSFSLSPEVKD